MSGGWLVVRLNSTSDHGYQSTRINAEVRIDEDYFFYFDIPRTLPQRSDKQAIVSTRRKISHLEELILTCYEKPKPLWKYVIRRV